MKAQQDMILLTKLQSDIQHLNLEVSELMKCLQVSYSEVLPNKTMVATLFLVNKESGSKFQIAIGNADCFLRNVLIQPMVKSFLMKMLLRKQNHLLNNLFILNIF